MRYTITGRNIDVTQGLREAVEDKLGKLEKYFTPDTEAVVTLSVQRELQKIEVTIPVKGSIIRAEESSSDMYVSIDLVEEVIERQLKKYKNKIIDQKQANAAFSDAYIQEEIEEYKQNLPSKTTDFYISNSLMHNFTNAAILVAECLYDYYQTGELVVYDYVGENYDPVKHQIKNFIVTKTDLQPLLAELENVQTPDHWKYQGWASEEILKQWLLHIQSVYQTLKEHL